MKDRNMDNFLSQVHVRQYVCQASFLLLIDYTDGQINLLQLFSSQKVVMGLLEDYSIASLKTCLQVCELYKEGRNVENKQLENNSNIIKHALECWCKFNANNLQRKKHKING